MKSYITTSILLLFSALVFSQEKQTELVTDRPDQTESSSVVPLNALQIETGFLFEKDNAFGNDYYSYSYPTTLFRYGILKNTEIRLGFDILGQKINNEELTLGLGPLYIGNKTKIMDEDGCKPEIAILGGLILPFTAKDEFKTRYTAADFRLAFSHTLNDMFSVGYNLGLQWDGENAGPGYFYSGSLGISVTEQFGVFGEYYGLLPEVGDKLHLLDAGLTYLVKPNLQLDFSFGIGVNDEATDHFIGFGLSYLISK
ncbi:transporter [Plebeiibacterium sediminum]|uniref:Transporter n=1 Tax=Plebeiibacterium sediminum TaxID=2992112 RepID=A0AAE3SGL2_9BACT|nr:transporter [Plebeiobacterium sediminum]MCW3787413.1 transporter [Plebeiobacterium sediminum]